MKSPLVSVIVPTYNSGEYVDACLASIVAQSYPQIELIVVDNSSTDNTKKIAKKYTAAVFNKGPERSAQRNYGVAQSKGEYVLIIDSDMQLSPDVVAACVKKIQSDDAIKALVVPEESFGEGFWAQCKKLERSFYMGVDWLEAARFFNKEVYLKIGGYDEALTGGEDYDLPQRVRSEFGKNSISRITELILHNEQKLSLKKTLKKKYYYAKQLSHYKSVAANSHSFRRQASIFGRYRLFFSKPGKLLKNPLYGIGMLFMKTCEFGIGGIAYIVSTVKAIK